MIKSTFTHKIATLALTTLCSVVAFNTTNAATFEETEVEQTSYVAVAQPFGENKYNLIVIEQIPNKNSCWGETGANPVNVDLLLLNFDFSGHCRRSTDANGYSIRFDGNDLGLEVILSLVERDGDLVLLGLNRRDPRQEPIVVGTAHGLNGQPMKIQLNPGWRFSKRTYQGKVLGHVYFSYDSAAAQMSQPVEEINNTMMDNTMMDNPDMVEQGIMQEIVAPSVNQ
jgi:hypothetical protein